jgi:hypothetical protein
MTVVKSLRTSEQEGEFRQLWSYLYEQVSTGKAATGVISGCAVSATTPSPSGSVVIGTGLAVCQPTTGGGAFPFLVTAAETVDVFTNNPMQFVNTPRTDIVGIDQTTGQAAVLVGTPNAIPSPPTVPSTFVPLAQLRHAANATTIPASVIDDLRVTVDPAAPTGVWKDLGRASGVGGTLKYRLRGQECDVAIDVTGSFPAGFTALSAAGALPAEARPSLTPPRGVAYTGSGTAMGSVEVLTAGTINVQVPAGTAGVAKALFTFPVG